jgi:predicted ester cyclase
MAKDRITKRAAVGLAAAILPIAATAAATDPKLETLSDQNARHKRVLEAFIEAVWRRGDLDALERYWTESCVNHAAQPGHDRGLAALRVYHEQFAAAFAAFAEARIAIVQQVADTDRVVTQMITTARHIGPFMGVAPTGRTVTLATIRIDRMEAGKIAEHWSVADMAGLMTQLHD